MYEQQPEQMYPPAFLTRMESMLGPEWPAFLESLCREEARGIRFRLEGPASRPEFTSQILHAVGADSPASFVPWAENAWYLTGDSRPGREIWHDLGAYYLQEPSAMSAASILAPLPGEKVLDLCAAPGGKATQLGAALHGKGLLVANEIHPARCKILARNIERMGIQNCVVTCESPENLADRLEGFFDKVLVDAPCSGEGMFRKNPEALQEWSPASVDGCAARQDGILEKAWLMLRPGGKLVYSTCTFSPQENEGTIGRFLDRHPDAELLPADTPWFSEGVPAWGNGNPALTRTRRLWPHRLRGEGHFAALLQKEENVFSSANHSKKNRLSGNSSTGKNRKQDLRRMVSSCLEDLVSPDLLQKILEGNLSCLGDAVWLFPENTPSLDGLRILYTGLPIGIIRKDRLEPAHGLAAAFSMEDVLRSSDFTSDMAEASAWFRGETLQTDGEPGWTLVTVDGLGAGWGKCTGGRLKNHLPKGLRWSR